MVVASTNQRIQHATMERGFACVPWLAQSNRLPSASDGTPAGPCLQALPLSPHESARIRTNEPRTESPGHTDGAASPADEDSSPNSSASSLWEPETWWEGGSSAGSEPSANRSARGSRTKFSAVQLQELERTFQGRRYLDAGEKQRLSEVLNLSPVQIKTWFQNRRMKFKHQMREAKVGVLISNYCTPSYCPEMSASSASPGWKYNVASHPAGSVLQIDPALPSPAWLMPPSLPVLPPVRSNRHFLLSPVSAFSPYQLTDPGNYLIRDLGGYPPHPPPF